MRAGILRNKGGGGLLQIHPYQTKKLLQPFKAAETTINKNPINEFLYNRYINYLFKEKQLKIHLKSRYIKLLLSGCK